MRFHARKVKGFSLIEVIIYVLATSVLIGIVLGLFLAAKRTIANQQKIQEKLDVLWKASALLDYLQGSESNLLTQLQRVYYTGGAIVIPVVSPYDTPVASLDGVENGFYAGACSSTSFAIWWVEAGKKKLVEGDNCSPPFFYRLGHSGIPAYVKLFENDGSVYMLEAVGTRTFSSLIEDGTFSFEMFDSNGYPVYDSRQAVYIGVKINGPVPVEVSTWKEQ